MLCQFRECSDTLISSRDYSTGNVHLVWDAFLLFFFFLSLLFSRLLLYNLIQFFYKEESLMCDYMFCWGAFISSPFAEGFHMLIFIRKSQSLGHLQLQSSRKYTGSWVHGNFIRNIYFTFICHYPYMMHVDMHPYMFFYLASIAHRRTLSLHSEYIGHQKTFLLLPLPFKSEQTLRHPWTSNI